MNQIMGFQKINNQIIPVIATATSWAQKRVH